MAMMLQDIHTCYLRAEEMRASHMVIAMDSFDYSDYPIYVMPGQDPRKVAREDGGRVMECYKLPLGWEVQSKEYRANHWEWEPVPKPETEDEP
jgi:hypothetical protein